MGVPLRVVDAFASRPFAGNPAAICLLQREAEPAWMQAVAAEMNLSETAFVVPAADGFGLRWFTPTIEVDLCGHATLAAAHVLWEDGILAAGREARFATRSGVLVAGRVADGIAIDLPRLEPRACAAPEGLDEALGCRLCWVGTTGMDLLVEVDDAGTVRGLRPDLRAIAELPVRGLCVTAVGDAPYDCVSRFFAPASGIPEDPVTGSAHCALAPFWARRLRRDALLGFQASARGGVVAMRLAGERVRLTGTAVTVLRGELLG